MRRFWSMFPLSRVPFWYRFFEPQPCGCLKDWKPWRMKWYFPVGFPVKTRNGHRKKETPIRVGVFLVATSQGPYGRHCLEEMRLRNLVLRFTVVRASKSKSFCKGTIGGGVPHFGSLWCNDISRYDMWTKRFCWAEAEVILLFNSRVVRQTLIARHHFGVSKFAFNPLPRVGLFGMFLFIISRCSPSGPGVFVWGQ